MNETTPIRSGRSKGANLAFASILIVLSACSGGGGGDGGSQDPMILTDMGVDLLNGRTETGLIMARDLFRRALDRDPENQRARFLGGGTGLAVFLEDDDEDEGDCSDLCMVLNGFGVGSGSRSIFAYGAIIPGMLPATSPTGADLQSLFDGELLPAVRAAAADFEAIVPTFTTTETLFGRVTEFDYADAQLIAAFLRLVETGILVSNAFDLEVDVDAVANASFSGEPYALMVGPSLAADPAQGLLAPPRGNPGGPALRGGVLNDVANTRTSNFLKPTALADTHLAAARLALIASISNYINGMIALRSETDPQADDFISLSFSQDCESATLEAWLADLLLGLKAGLVGGSGGVQTVPARSSTLCSFDLPRLDFDAHAAFMGSTYANRSFLPDISGAAGTDPTRATAADFADPTLNGAFPNLLGDRLARTYNAFAEGFEDMVVAYQARGAAMTSGPRLVTIDVQGMPGPIYANYAAQPQGSATLLNSRITFVFDSAVDPASLPSAANPNPGGITIVDPSTGVAAQGSFALDAVDPTRVHFDPQLPTASDCVAGFTPATAYILTVIGADITGGNPLTFSGQALPASRSTYLQTAVCSYSDQVPGAPLLTGTSVDYSAGVAVISLSAVPDQIFDFNEALLPSTARAELIDTTTGAFVSGLSSQNNPVSGLPGVTSFVLPAAVYGGALIVGRVYQVDLSSVQDLTGIPHVTSPLLHQFIVTP